jgi:hypothetical protein
VPILTVFTAVATASTVTVLRDRAESITLCDLGAEALRNRRLVMFRLITDARDTTPSRT